MWEGATRERRRWSTFQGQQLRGQVQGGRDRAVRNTLGGWLDGGFHGWTGDSTGTGGGPERKGGRGQIKGTETVVSKHSQRERWPGNCVRRRKDCGEFLCLKKFHPQNGLCAKSGTQRLGSKFSWGLELGAPKAKTATRHLAPHPCFWLLRRTNTSTG